ncbi:GNAT family N-acetyltransferase [Alicyclobacillus sp. ALC3]|uniref:GNAT family N-acetyltransferase n=1 Tax=Alicyclobacillus sp. ALC3 TaxID=2796143 RepID=UPI002379B7FA|nr:GNAT family N-acetyltransferase [Alicyclobacillus sp. ALC3]WDL96714.1 GNAT family N-acetyltransferase [Alicyclobacillus sp. ALC3]
MTDDFKISTPSPFGCIQTNRLVLRIPRLDDSADVFAIHGNPETNRHNPAGPMKDLVEAKERITGWIRDWADDGIGYWRVTELDGAQVIGVSGVRVMEWSGRQVLNLYYRYGPAAWGKGYATEVASEAIEVAQEYFPELPVIARTRPTNLSSMKVAERVGLVRRLDLDTNEHVVFASWWRT